MTQNYFKLVRCDSFIIYSHLGPGARRCLESLIKEDTRKFPEARK
jgi:hypothetical protein